MEAKVATLYKIHPAIGIARVGDHPDSFFIGPELSYAAELKDASQIKGASPIELDGNGTEVAFATYKKDGQIRRQGARFRIFAYDQGPGGTLANPREIKSSANAEITWSVELCNRKAAWDRRIGGQGSRNPDIADRSKLIVGPAEQSISGPRQSSAVLAGQFFGHSAQGKNITLGVLKTDAEGRLIVLGGFGQAFNDGTNQDLSSGNFGNRDGWTDDIADGPVTAQLKIDGQIASVSAARVIVGPPDFAPGIAQPVTLYDTVRQVAATFGAPDPTRPSFSRDVLPILSRCTNLRWTNGLSLWGKLRKTMKDDWVGLSNNTDAATATIRQQVARALSTNLPLMYSQDPDDVPLQLTNIQKKILALWAARTFNADWSAPPQPSLSNPDDLDRGQLDCAVGGGFFPGIEAGDRMKDRNIYVEPFRLKPDLPAGFLTEQMAVPWHSDFWACNVNWWPSQRPDLAPQREDPNGFFPQWTSGLVGSVSTMIANFSKLGYIKPITINGQSIQVEDERIPPRSQVA
jgi:L-Lysine epsilon oxidase N-terminal/L-lysine epsilon oxidase C-terminal domain